MDTSTTPTVTAKPLAPTPAASANKPKISSDFDTFLRMLTTQLQNQDPLNPMESTDFAVQLATFSQVEQAQRSNQLLETMSSQLGMTGMAQLANWVGMEARAPAPAWFTGRSLTLAPNPAMQADEAVLVVRDDGGRVVYSQEVAVSDEPIVWDGRSADGAALPQGRYSFELESRRSGEILSVTTVQTYGRIVEARGGADGTTLVLEGGVEVSSASVTAVRKP